MPIHKGSNKHCIIGILLTKSLLGLDPNKNQTVRELYREQRIQVRIPLYMHKEAPLGKLVNEMKSGRSHMAVIVESSAQASELRDLADDFNRNVVKTDTTNGTEEGGESIHEEDGEVTVLGIVTLENVIERILLTDIHDEKDRSAAKNLRDRMATIVYRSTHVGSDSDFQPKTSMA